MTLAETYAAELLEMVHAQLDDLYDTLVLGIMSVDTYNRRTIDRYNRGVITYLAYRGARRMGW